MAADILVLFLRAKYKALYQPVFLNLCSERSRFNQFLREDFSISTLFTGPFACGVWLDCIITMF